MRNSLPYFTKGVVVKGFGRGSKSLGTPTANLDQSVINQLPSDLGTGVYFGWAQVNNRPVYPMVASLGWNPYFANKTESLETYIMHEFSEDFYGAELKICLAGYLRDEQDFQSLDDLKMAIQKDIDDARKNLLRPEFQLLAQDSFFSNLALEQNLKDKNVSASPSSDTISTKT